MHGILNDVFDLVNGLHRNKGGLFRHEDIVLDEALVKKVFHAARYELGRVSYQTVELVHFVGVLSFGVAEELVGEAWDVLDRRQYVVADSCVEKFHHVVFVSLFLKGLKLGDVTQVDQIAFNVVIQERLDVDQVVSIVSHFNFALQVDLGQREKVL